MFKQEFCSFTIPLHPTYLSLKKKKKKKKGGTFMPEKHAEAVANADFLA